MGISDPILDTMVLTIVWLLKLTWPFWLGLIFVKWVRSR